MSIEKLSKKSREIQAQKKFFVENLNSEKAKLEKYPKQKSGQINFEAENEKRQISDKIKKYESLISECEKLIKAINNLKKKPEARHSEIDSLIEKSNIYTEIDLPQSTKPKAVTRLDPVKEGLPDDASFKKKVIYTIANVIASAETTRGLRGTTTDSDGGVQLSANKNINSNKLLTQHEMSNTRALDRNSNSNSISSSANKIEIDPKVKSTLKNYVNRLKDLKDEDLELDLRDPDPVKIHRAMEAAECLIQLAPIVDASRSQVDAFNGVKNFVKQLLDKANVAPGLSALVINAFNTKGYTSATIADKFNLQQNKNFLDGLQSDGGTVMSKALELVHGQIVSGTFTPEIGKKIMIPLISDGMVNTNDIQAIRNNIASIYAAVNQKTGGKTIEDAKKYVQFVGIWIEGLDGLNEDLLKEICPEPEYRFVFKNPDSLINATNSVLTIMKALCGAPITSASPTASASPTITSSPTIGQIAQSSPTTKAPSAKPTANPTAAPTFAPELWWTLLIPFIFPREAAENAQLLEDDIDQEGSVESQEVLNVLREITVDAPGDIKEALNNLISSKLLEQAAAAKADPLYWEKKNALLARSKKWKKEDGKWIYDGWKKTASGDWKKDGSALTKTNVDYQKLVLEDLGRMGIYATDFKGDIPPNDEDITPEAPPPAPPLRRAPPKPSKKEYYIPKQFRMTWLPIPTQVDSIAAIFWVAALGFPLSSTPFVVAQALALSKISTWLKDHPEKYSLAMSRLYPTLLNKVVPEKAADMVGRLLESIAPGRVVSEDEFKKIIEEVRKNSVNIDIDQINAGKRKPR